jgi:hypothetical protein
MLFRKLLRFVPLLITLSLAPLCAANATTSLTITPGYPPVGVGNSVQFKVTLNGKAVTGLTWYCNNVLGGNSVSGTVSQTGLYTAPKSVPAGSVEVYALGPTGSGEVAAVYVDVRGHGPKIASVSPKSLTAGSFTVTIAGSAFQSGATAFISYGDNKHIPLATQSESKSDITASGYVGGVTSASFDVRNPDSEYSNAIAVPVVGGAPAQDYTLTVYGGSGSGSYESGQVVAIKADTPPTGDKFSDWTGATVANPKAASTTLTMPAANTTVVANFTGSAPQQYALTVVNGSGSGMYSAGTQVTITASTPPSGDVFGDWTGATVASANSATTTLTMPAAATTVTANFVPAPVVIPYPVTTHPRLWVTPADVTRLQGWATSSNPVYAQGIAPMLAQAVSVYNTYYFPNGVQANPWPDPGDVEGYGFLPSNGPALTSNAETWAMVLAFGSLIDPSPANRIRDAQYARNLIMPGMRLAALGPLAGAPFRDPSFATFNRAGGTGNEWPLVVDWIYNDTDSSGNPILSASDKATIRAAFLVWANECLNAETSGGDHPAPIGVTNSAQLLPGNEPYRYACNNYYSDHARLIAMMSLAFDPADDPAVNPAEDASVLGNSIRSYIPDVTGAWLYQQYAMMGDPDQVSSDYGIPNTGSGFGLASGGFPPEGTLYGESYGTILEELLALQTAGFNNPEYSGPQIKLIGAPVWDRFVDSMLSDMTPAPFVPASESYLGSVYEFASYGDVLRLWVTPVWSQPFALVSLLEQENGETTNLNADRWFAVNAVQGGASALMNRISDPWVWGAEQSIFYYMLLDPSAPAATDPRPSMPTVVFDPAAGRVVAHTDWTPSGTMFDYRASWINIDHQNADGGEFELYRKGEWLTKQMTNYDSNAEGMTSPFHNTLTMMNWCPAGTPNLMWYEEYIWPNGSEFMEGLDNGDPTTVMSSGNGYVYVNSDLTNLFNRPQIWSTANNATDIQQATRSVLWLDGDYIVIYDRSTSLHSGLFKRFNLSLTTNPVISGNTATETLPDGQQLFVQTLLPAGPSITSIDGAALLSNTAELEPSRYIMTVQDPSDPTDTRFLHVLQGADAGAPMVAATHIANTSGTPFDGALFGVHEVFFPVTTTSTFGATVFPVASGVTDLIVTGLAPSTAYSVTTGSGTVKVAPGGSSATADSAGMLRIAL